MRSLSSLLALLTGVTLAAVTGPIGLSACSSNKTTASNAGGNATAGGESSAGGSSSATTGGESSAGGSSSANTGGAVQSGGSPSTGGVDATGGNATGGASQCGPVPVPKALMTDFSEIADGASTYAGASLKWGTATSLTGGTFVYGQDTAGADTPLGTITGGALNITASIAASHYGGFGFYFGPNCGSDACAYTGFSFTVAGSLTGCSVDIQMQQTSDYPLNDNNKGKCDFGDAGITYDNRWSYCTNPHTGLSAQLSGDAGADPQVVQIPFTTLTSGNPVSNVDCSQLLGIQIQFNSTGSACTVNLTLDDLAFYK